MDGDRHGRAHLGLEACADGIDMTFAPMVDIAPRPALGPHLRRLRRRPLSRLADAARHRQRLPGRSPDRPDSIMAAVKHFALYGAVEGGRDYNTVDMSPMRMYQDYLPPYRAAIDAGAGGVMVALNSINGVPATSNTWLMQDLLRKDWGFKGVTVSDHGAITELVKHGVAKDGREAAKLAIKAGIDMSMADSLYLATNCPGWSSRARSTWPELDDARARGAGRQIRHGPVPRSRSCASAQPQDDPADVNAESRLHRAAGARGGAQVHGAAGEPQPDPAAEEGRHHRAGRPAGRCAGSTSWAAGRPPAWPSKPVTLRAGMREAIEGQGAPDLRPRRQRHRRRKDRRLPELPQLGQARGHAGPAHAGRDDRRGRQGRASRPMSSSRRSASRAACRTNRRAATSLDMPASQRALLQGAQGDRQAAGARADERPAAGAELGEERTPTRSWKPGSAGTEGGNAIADVLFGDYNPSGKLPISFPRSVGQIPDLLQPSAARPPVRRGQAGQLHLAVFRGEERPACIRSATG